MTNGIFVKSHPYKTLIFLWLAWSAIILGFQVVVTTRMGVQRPDYGRSWTHTETRENSNKGKIYLLEPFLNRQVAWDSEYYLSIAVGGYDDPDMRRIETQAGFVVQNYAFFPFYPIVISLLMPLFSFLPLTAIGQAALIGVIISLLGTLAGIIALYDLANFYLQDANASLRAVVYLLVFPSSFFLAQVYTEGLFIGLAFTSLALIRRKYFLPAAVLAAAAFFTRAVGAALVLPLAWRYWKSLDLHPPFRQLFTWRNLVNGLAVLLPIAAALAWAGSSQGATFRVMERDFFGRGVFSMAKSIDGWIQTLDYAVNGHPHARVVHAMEILGTLLALHGAIWVFRKAPDIGLFSLAALAIAAFSGEPQSMIRYVLVLPGMYLMLASWGRRPAFDRAWSLGSALLMGMNLFLYSFDMWVA